MSEPSAPTKARFSDFGLRPELMQVLEQAGFEEPTPIQAQAVPRLLRGGDLVGVAETGTGYKPEVPSPRNSSRRKD